MRVTCPKCEFTGNIRDELIPLEGKNVNCPKCKTRFLVKRQDQKKTNEQVNPNNNTKKVNNTKYIIFFSIMAALFISFFVVNFFQPGIFVIKRIQWIPFDEFYSENLNYYKDAMDIEKEKVLNSPVTATGEVFNIERNDSKSTYGYECEYIVMIKVRKNVYVKMGTSDDVSGINKSDVVTVYGKFSDYSDLLIGEIISLRDGHVEE